VRRDGEKKWGLAHRIAGVEEGGSGERARGAQGSRLSRVSGTGPGAARQRSQQCMVVRGRGSTFMTGEAEADGWVRRRTMPFFNYSKIFKLIQIRVMQIWLFGATKFSNKIWACIY
jgi:hypothetical protein